MNVQMSADKRRLDSRQINYIKRIPGVKRVERRTMIDLRREVGTKACIVGKIVKATI